MNNKKPKILIVDDKIENLVALERILVDLDVQFARALSGNEALMQTLEHDFAIALLDVQMPEMDGYETVEIMRQDRKTKHLPVIFISAIYRENYYQIKGIESGAVDFITKPIVPELLVGKVKVFLDLYKHKRSLEDEIKRREESEKQLRLHNTALKAAANSIIIASSDGTMTWVNDSFTKLTGYSFDEATGHKLNLLKSGKHDQQFYKALWKTVLAGKVWHGEMINKRKDGTFYTEEMTITPVQDVDNKVTHFIAIKQDITKRKQAEEELKQAKEIAEAANKAKSKFLANMSHELRTPLNGILGYTQILKRDKALNEKQKNGLDVIHQSGEHLLTLINDILDLSKVEAGKMELHLTEFPLLRFLNSIVDIFKIPVSEKNIWFTYERISDLPSVVKSDEKRLRQVLINLLGNAVKFTDKGGVALKVGIYNAEEGQGDIKLQTGKNGDKAETKTHCIRFQIEDTGVGMDTDDLEKIFAPFRQVGDQQAKLGGTGLGLSISHRLVKMMGGELQVESVSGEGTTFWFEIEMEESITDIDLGESEELVIIGLKGPQQKVLVVDDKWENRSVLVNMLRPLGFKMLEAVDGQDALEKVEGFKPDIILMDLVMPIMTGLEATKNIRQIDCFKDIIIIAISASAFGRDEQKSIDAGCNAFIAKPFRLETLLQQMQHYMGLEWIYENGQEVAQKKQVEQENENENEDDITTLYMSLPEQELIALFDAARQGDIHSIVKQADKLEQIDLQFEPFATELRQLAKRFRIKQIRDLVTKIMENNKTANETH